MKQKLINKNAYTKACESCLNGRLSADKDRVLCKNHGIMRTDSVCGDYKYDPLKRIPKRPRKLTEFSEEDFKL